MAGVCLSIKRGKEVYVQVEGAMPPLREKSYKTKKSIKPRKEE
jgi:hypothetical protein